MIRACIFDLGGTIVDRYSLTPFLSFKKIFENKGIYVSNELLSKDMGKDKREHIRNIMNSFIVTNQWFNKYNDYPDELDINKLMDNFNEIQIDYSDKIIDILPETKECIDNLQFNSIKTGCTTGFNKENMEIIQNKLIRNNIYLNSYVSSTCLNKPTRPHPHMIYKNMDNLDIKNPLSVIKVDDTITGIHEGVNAKCWTVGVARWSVNMNITSIEDAYYLDEGLHSNEINERLKTSRKILRDAGADYVIDTLNELPILIEKINNKLI